MGLGEQGLVGLIFAGLAGRVVRRIRARRARAPARTPGHERLTILDTWLRSELPATEFSALVGVSPQTLSIWRRKFEEEGPAGLMGYRQGAGGSRLPEHVRRAILMMKNQHEDWGQDRIHDMLLRSQGIQASPGAIQRVLLDAGYQVKPVSTRPHPPKERRFERSKPGELWQTDLFTFMLKRQRRRVHLVAFMDDVSRFIVGFGIHASAAGAPVREVFESAIANYGAPVEVLRITARSITPGVARVRSRNSANDAESSKSWRAPGDRRRLARSSASGDPLARADRRRGLS